MKRRLGIIGAVLLAAGAVTGTAILIARPDRTVAPGREAVIGLPDEGEQIVALVATTLHDGDGSADSLTLFGIDRTGRRPVTVFIPTGTLVQIPAYTYGPVGDALVRSDFLQRLSIENLMGVAIDRTFVLDDVALGQIVDVLGGINVNVTEEIYVTNDEGGKELQFALGPQKMDPATAVTYMTTRGEQSEVVRFARQQKVLEAIFSSGAQKVRDAIRQVSKESLDPEDASSLAEVFGAMAAPAQSERLYEPLPVEPVLSGGDDETYSVPDAKLDPLVQRAFPRSLRGALPSQRPRVEVRNADGTPGAGERAAAILIEGGMHVAVAKNAQTFGLDRTKILIYADDEPSRVLGDRIRELLGIGRVEVAQEGQTVVQVTVVIGKDFVRG